MAYTTIKKASDYFNTVTYAGDGTTNRSITGVNFQPDWVWIKNRSTTNEHLLFDVIRGVQVALNSNDTTADDTISNALTAFNSDGFSVSGNASTNANSSNYVGWNWLASNTTASNTDGSITSTVSASTTSGFSIVSYTGTLANATVGHGLGVAPKVIFIKCRGTNARSWVVYHDSIGNTKHLTLNEADAEATSSASFNNTSPTSSVFSLGNSNNANDSTTMIAYCFADVQGFSKFGSYTGNGSTDGTFVYTGFKPALIITKPTANISSWNITDSKRSTYNDGSLERLKANTSDAETSTSNFDILSNGFKLRTTDNDYNPSGLNVIYMAFAEEPLVGDNPATAR